MVRLRKNLMVCMVVCGVVATSGCSSYRTSSNIKADQYKTIVVSPSSPVKIVEGDLVGQDYTVISPIEVSVKKLTAFDKDPTKEQANEALVKNARLIGANAVINVTYQNGIGMMTWGYMDAKGLGVQTSAKKKGGSDLSVQLQELDDLYKDGALTESEYKSAKQKVLSGG